MLNHRCRQHTNNVMCIFVVSLLPDDPELDRSQAGGRPVREGQCQRHRQSPQHLSALCCLCGYEKLRGGERNGVTRWSCWRMSFIFCAADLSVLHVIGPDKDFIASKMCLTVLCQSLQSGASALCFITVSSKKYFLLCFSKSFTAYELRGKPTFCNESKLSSTLIGSLGRKNPDIILWRYKVWTHLFTSFLNCVCSLSLWTFSLPVVFLFSLPLPLSYWPLPFYLNFFSSVFYHHIFIFSIPFFLCLLHLLSPLAAFVLLCCESLQFLLPLHYPLLSFSSHSFCSLFSPSLIVVNPERGGPFCGGWGQVDAMRPCRAASPHRAGPQPGVTDGFLLLFSSAVKHRRTWWNQPAAIQGGETTVTRAGSFLLAHFT